MALWEAIVENKQWADRPLWVRIGLFGVRSRAWALTWVWVAIATAFAVLVLCVGLALWLARLALAEPPIPFFGEGTFLFYLALGLVGWVSLLSVALLAWLTIQWVDEHDGWALVRRPAGRRESHAAPALRDQAVAPMTQ